MENLKLDENVISQSDSSVGIPDIPEIKEFIIGLALDSFEDHHDCWWTIFNDKNWEDCHWEQGHILVRCGACGKQTLEWDPYDIYDYCGDRPYMYCSNCEGSFILCVNTNENLDNLHNESCCRVLTKADQHEIDNFEQIVFREGKPIPIMFIECHALSITHLSPIQFRDKYLIKKGKIVPKSYDELKEQETLEGEDENKEEYVVELKNPVFDYGGQGYELCYRGICSHCGREALSRVSAD